MKLNSAIIIFLMLFVVINTLAQTKPKSKEKPPTLKEMQEMQKEMQQSWDEMSDEEKKEMEKAGFKMPDMKALQRSGVTEAQMKKAWENDERIVPLKDAKRIAAIRPTPSKALLAAYISQVHNAVVTKMEANDKADGETVYLSAKQNTNSTTLGNAALGLWIGKYPLLAIYVMGKACMEDPADINNINNYAAMLSMLGAEHLSLPILQNLNKQYPNNSTILNNIGQAWFGLGDIDKSEKYLDSAIRIYSFHSQANLTKSKIEESKGNTTAAAEAVRRSIKTAYSIEKETRMKKFGQNPNGKDIDWPFPMPQDPLGLHRFVWPAFPTEPYGSVTLENEWNQFKETCYKEIENLEAKEAILEKQSEEENELRTNRVLSAGYKVNINDIMPPLAPKANLKLSSVVTDKDGGIYFQFNKLMEDLAESLKKDAELQSKEGIAKQAIAEHYDPLFGEGRPNPSAEYCNAMNEESKKYLTATNKNLEETQRVWLEIQRKRVNDMMYFAQYTMWPIDFELAKVRTKIAWLEAISKQIVRFRRPNFECDFKENKDVKAGKLAEFDDIACKYTSTMNLHFIKLISSCSRLEGKFDMGPIAYSRKKDMDKDILLGASLAITVGAKKGWEKGPVAAEVKATITGQIEWDETQITDWVVKSEVGVSAGSNIGTGDKSIEIAGVEAAIGMNGSSIKGRGLLKTIYIISN